MSQNELSGRPEINYQDVQMRCPEMSFQDNVKMNETHKEFKRKIFLENVVPMGLN